MSSNDKAVREENHVLDPPDSPWRKETAIIYSGSAEYEFQINNLWCECIVMMGRVVISGIICRPLIFLFELKLHYCNNDVSSFFQFQYPAVQMATVLGMMLTD